MLYSIKSNDTVLDLKVQFTDLFPGLKLEVFGHEHGDHEGSPKKDTIKGTVLIKEILPDFDSATLLLEEHMTVSAVERLFHDEVGLNVQVFRKMGVIWLETIQTDNYTLSEQMKLSAESRA